MANAWEDAAREPNFAARTTLVHAALHKWDKEILKAPKKRLDDLKARLEATRS